MVHHDFSSAPQDVSPLLWVGFSADQKRFSCLSARCVAASLGFTVGGLGMLPGGVGSLVGPTSWAGGAALAQGVPSPGASPGEPVPDRSLGSEASLVFPNAFGVSGLELVLGGARRGDNLFHSFEKFGVPEAAGVYFFRPDLGVQTILARVTGGQVSVIDGTLGVLEVVAGQPRISSNVNLFLLNPNGVIFGPSASLDVGGSFVASSADGLRFGDRGLFDAAAGGNGVATLLTVQPSALVFSQNAFSQNIDPGPGAGAIVHRSQAPAGQDSQGNPLTGLRVGTGSTLALVGGPVIIEGGGSQAPSGLIQLGGLGAPGEVAIAPRLEAPANFGSRPIQLDFPPDSFLPATVTGLDLPVDLPVAPPIALPAPELPTPDLPAPELPKEPALPAIPSEPILDPEPRPDPSLPLLPPDLGLEAPSQEPLKAAIRELSPEWPRSPARETQSAEIGSAIALPRPLSLRVAMASPFPEVLGGLEATGWQVDRQGQIQLLAAPTIPEAPTRSSR